jgi:hypothetical protein
MTSPVVTTAQRCRRRRVLTLLSRGRHPARSERLTLPGERVHSSGGGVDHSKIVAADPGVRSLRADLS